MKISCNIKKFLTVKREPLGFLLEFRQRNFILKMREQICKIPPNLQLKL